jgi:hypothetical protein
MVFILVVHCQVCTASELIFTGTCDGSAAYLTSGGELANANDEDDVIRVYDLRDSPSPRSPLLERSLEEQLAQAKPKKEADFEGAAVRGDRVYWIGSHGRDSKGNPEIERRVLIATDRSLNPVGRPYKLLLDDLLKGDQEWQVGLAGAIGLVDQKDAQLPPEKAGINIEALGYLPGGKGDIADDSLLVGLRNPQQGPAALLLPLLNVDAVLLERETPRFAPPIRLDLDGLGVRDLAWSEADDVVLILAGTKDDRKSFRIYRWSGRGANDPILVADISQLDPKLNPEALVPLNNHDILLLSDDGDAMLETTPAACEADAYKDGACPCKSLLQDQDKRFRGRTLTLPEGRG